MRQCVYFYTKSKREVTDLVVTSLLRLVKSKKPGQNEYGVVDSSMISDYSARLLNKERLQNQNEP